jgi:hypothetical protein
MATVQKHMTFSIKDAEDSLAQLRAAVEERRSALDAQGKLEELGEEANRKGNQLREEMGEQFDPIEWNRRCGELPAEQQITAIHAAVRAADSRVREVRKQFHASLDSLRSWKAAGAFSALDSVPWDVRDESTDRSIRLGESILVSSRSTKSKKAGRRNEELARLKGKVHKLYIENERPTYRIFCKRLDAHKVSLPTSTEIAFKRAEGAVSRWFSGAVNPEA